MLATRNQDFAVWQHDAVVKSAGVGHGVDGGDGGGGVGIVDGDDVGIGCAVGVCVALARKRYGLEGGKRETAKKARSRNLRFDPRVAHSHDNNRIR